MARAARGMGRARAGAGAEARALARARRLEDLQAGLQTIFT